MVDSRVTISCSLRSDGSSATPLRGEITVSATDDHETVLCAAPVTRIPGVGPRTAARLARLGIFTVRDLVLHFPVRHEEFTDTSACDWTDGDGLTVQGIVCGSASVRFSGRRCLVSVPVRVRDATVRAIFFNQSYLRHQLLSGVAVRLRGKWDAAARTLAVSAHEIVRQDSAGIGAGTGLRPVYRLTDGLSNQALLRYIQSALRLCDAVQEDEIPEELRARFRLLPKISALRALHEPGDREVLRQARRRLVFEEFLLFQLRLQGFRKRRTGASQTALDFVELDGAAREFVRHLPFVLTSGQEAALAESLRDIADPHPMHRMIQGDVGSGKTAVVFALCAALARAGRQSALMVPTGILARQHYLEAIRLLAPCGLRVGMLVGDQKPQERERTRNAVATGEIDLLIGTHALVTQQVAFWRLRLVVIDEQHRFGVSVRRLLRAKGEWSDVLQLSATPIPRSLALTIFRDIELSTIRDLPPGRLPVRTIWLRKAEEEKAVRLLRRELAKGRQAFIVAPRIGEGGADGSEMTSAVALHERMQEELAGWRVALVHGGMAEAERLRAMSDFVQGSASALVATSIVEVGVSVSNATVMVIHDAERFGLATLHQLRGRVGRGDHPSTCVLVGDPVTPAACARLQAMLETSDGFALSEQDMRLRGLGEVLGDRQSGLPEFRIGDVVADLRVMTAARDVAGELLGRPDFWLLPAYEPLRRAAMAEDDDVLADS